MLELDYLPANDSASILLEGDDDMAITDGQFNDLKNNVSTLKTDVKGLKDDIKTLKIDVGSIKTDISEFTGSLKVIKGIAMWAAVPVLAWATFITYNVIAMMNGGGTSKIVAELKAPKSQEQLRANLSTVIAQVQTARAEKKKPNSQKVEALSKAVSQVVQQNPSVPEAWGAAAELISYHTEMTHPNAAHLPPCNIGDAKPESRETNLPNNGKRWNMGFFFSSCSLRLEDVPPLLIYTKDWPKDWPVHALEAPGVTGTRVGFPVYLTNGEVIYDGGTIQHEAGFAFINCIFKLHTTGVPDEPAKTLLTAGLKRDDLIEINLPSATHS